MRHAHPSCTLVACLTLALCACGKGEQPVEGRLTTARMLVKAGKVAEAAELLDGLSAQTRDPKTLHRIALSQQTAGDLGGAVASLGKAIEIAPKHHLVRLQLATTLAVLGQADPARGHAIRLIEMAPSRSGGPLLFAALARPRELATAIEHLERWRKGADARTVVGLEVLLALEDLHRRRGEQARELETPIEVAKLSNPPGALQLAQIYRHAERREVSAALLRAAGAADPTLPVWGTLAALETDLGRLDEAEAALGKLAAAERGRPRHEVVRGAILLARGQLTQAVKVLRAAKDKLAPAARHGRVSLLLAQALARSGDLGGARDELLAMKAAGPTTPGTLLLADVLRQRGDLAGAARVLEPLLADPDTREQGHSKLVAMYLSAGSVVSAAPRSEAWLKAQPGHPPALLAAARLELLRAEPGKAKEIAAAVVDGHPGMVPAVDLLVAALRALDDAAGARVAIDEQLARSPTPGMLDFAGFYLQSNGESAEAEKLFRRLLALDRSDAGPWARLARLMREQGRAGEALPMYQQALVLAPNDLKLALEVAPLEADAGQHDAAIAHYEQVLASGVDDASLINNLAYLYAQQGKNLARALELATRAQRALPDSPEVFDTLGWVHHRRGDHDIALRLLRQAAAKLPQRANVLYHLGMVEVAAGQKAAGKGSLERALGLDPDLPQAATARASIEAAEGAGATP